MSLDGGVVAINKNPAAGTTLTAEPPNTWRQRLIKRRAGIDCIMIVRSKYTLVLLIQKGAIAFEHVAD